jgi:putative phosphoribosyl transferase
MNVQVVRIASARGVGSEASLHLPHHPSGVVVFAGGSAAVAAALHQRDFATLVLEAQVDDEDAHDIGFIGRRVLDALDWARAQASLQHMPVALFGAGIGAAAALVAAAERQEATHAVIAHDGRPELAGEALPRVEAPTLLMIGAADGALAEMNREAMRRMRAHVEIEVAAGADVGELTAGWCQRYLWSMA